MKFCKKTEKSGFVGKFGVDKVTQAIRQDGYQPGGKAQWCRKRDDGFVSGEAFGDDFGCVRCFHKEGHRAGVLIGNTGADESGANNVDPDVVRFEFDPQGFSISFDRCFAGTV